MSPHRHPHPRSENEQQGPVTRPKDGRPGEGERLTPDVPLNAARHPPGNSPPATPAARDTGPHERTLPWGRRRDGVPTPAPRRCPPRGWAAGGRRAPRPTRPTRRQAAPSLENVQGARTGPGERPLGTPGVQGAGPRGCTLRNWRQTHTPHAHNRGHNLDHYRHRKATEGPYRIPALRHSNRAMAEPTAPRNTRP